MANRPAIPADLERAVLVEAGHRCAIPVCRQVPIEIAHIIGYARCKKHEFHNLIPLCPTCHARFDKGEIDHQSMLRYKLNLALLNRRYGDTEARVLEWFARDRSRIGIRILAEMEVLLLHLVDDGLLEDSGREEALAGGAIIRKTFYLTQAGKDYVEQWLALDRTQGD
jgi:hypothetical protein